VTWCTWVRPLLACSALLFASACGGSGDQDTDADAVSVTVFVPSGGFLTNWSPSQLTWSLEYKVACFTSLGGSSSSEDAFTVEGTLEQTDGFELQVDGPTAVWKGSIAFEPGPCTIQLRARDADGEVLCSYQEPMTLDSPLPSEAYFNMICYATCPTIPLPDPETIPKLSCAPVGGLIVSAETPVEGVQSVRYVITGTDFLDNNMNLSIVDEGELELVGPGSTDLGEGPMQTNTWEGIVGVIVALEEPYGLELTALDADGTPLCSAATSIELLSGGIAQVHVVLPCSN